MDSKLDPLFKLQFRQTETLDTRQGIRRHDPDAERRKQKGKDNGTEDDDFWQDSQTVSVSALKTFLEQLLKDSQTTEPAAKAAGENIALSAQAQKTTSEDQKEKAGHAAKAAAAYQRTYRATHDDAPAALASDAIPSIQLSPDELRKINILLKDLIHLIKNHVQEISLSESTSFLQSLIEGVENAKNKLSH